MKCAFKLSIDIGEKFSISKMVTYIDCNTDAYIDLNAIRNKLALHSIAYAKKMVNISDLIGLNDIDVIVSYGNFNKGAIVVLSDGEIIDGRHRAALAYKLGLKQIEAYCPVVK